MPPAPAGSLGDEAMVHVVVGELQEAGVPVKLVDLGGRPYDGIGADAVLRMTGWLNHSPYGNLRSLPALSRNTHLFVLGADTMDGTYSERRSAQRAAAAYVGHAIGLEAAVLGFSFKEEAAPSSVRALRGLPSGVRLYARDPVSRGRLERDLRRPVTQAADLAFLLRPDASGPEPGRLTAWADQQRSEGRRLLGVNANAVHADAAGGPRELVRAYAEAVTRVVADVDMPASVLLIPHDDRSEWNDIRLADEVQRALPVEARAHVDAVRFPIRAAEIKAITGLLDAAVTGRMHLAIACLGRGVPAAGVTYQGKFEGLYRLFGLDGLSIDPTQGFGPDSITGAARRLLSDAEVMRDRVRARLPEIQRLARVNLETVLPVDAG